MATHKGDTFQPPTVPIPPPIHTYTNHSEIPSALTKRVDGSGPPRIIIGIDEAGRGPIIGPMVYSLAYCSTEFGEEVLPNCEFADSKKLTEPKRWDLMKRICNEDDNPDNDLSPYIGYAITSLTSLDISTCMLRPSTLVVNLNEQAHNATIELVKSVIKRLRDNIGEDVIIEGVYIDTVGPPASYTKKLRQHFSFDDVKDIRVEKKADATYPIVSAASVVAKVTRDWFIECAAKTDDNVEPENWGSGYPSDPKTSSWINGKLDPWFGWDLNIRYSWGTARDALNRSKISIEMRWEHELVKKHGFDDVLGMLDTKNFSRTGFEVGKDWFVL